MQPVAISVQARALIEPEREPIRKSVVQSQSKFQIIALFWQYFTKKEINLKADR